MGGFLTFLTVAIVVTGTFTVLLFKFIVAESHAGLYYRNGRFVRQLSPGAHWLLWRPSARIELVDLRQRTVTVPGQELLTSDHVGLKVSVAITFRIQDPVRAMQESQDSKDALYVATQLALRRAIGELAVDDLLAQKMSVGPKLLPEVAIEAERLGIQVQSVEVKDVMFPGELKKIFNEVVRARKEGQAALERARGETAALRNLANAAKMLENNPALMNLRILQSLSCAGGGNSIVLGLPQGLVPMMKPTTSDTAPSDEPSSA